VVMENSIGNMKPYDLVYVKNESIIWNYVIEPRYKDCTYDGEYRFCGNLSSGEPVIFLGIFNRNSAMAEVMCSRGKYLTAHDNL